MAEPQIFVKCMYCTCMSGPFKALSQEELERVPVVLGGRLVRKVAWVEEARPTGRPKLRLDKGRHLRHFSLVETDKRIGGSQPS